MCQHQLTWYTQHSPSSNQSLNEMNGHMCLLFVSRPILSASSDVSASSRASLISNSFIRRSESGVESVPSSICIPFSSSCNKGWQFIKLSFSHKFVSLLFTVRRWRCLCRTSAVMTNYSPKIQVMDFTHHIKTTTQRLKQSLVCFVHKSRLDFWILLFFLQKSLLSLLIMMERSMHFASISRGKEIIGVIVIFNDHLHF